MGNYAKIYVVILSLQSSLEGGQTRDMMMKKILCIAFVAILLGTMPVFGADEKIDPKTFICAELLATITDLQPPLYEGLQIDGYAAGLTDRVVADPASMEEMLLKVYDSCSAKPAETVLAHWQELRKDIPAATEGPWRADRTTCGDYAANEDDGSGFVIWLDGYQRAKTGKTASVFTDQATLDHFLAQCKANPGKLMIDVMMENAK